MADETDLRLYLVEHDLRGLSAAQLADAHLRPDEHRCLCLFESAGPDLVRQVN